MRCFTIDLVDDAVAVTAVDECTLYATLELTSRAFHVKNLFSLEIRIDEGKLRKGSKFEVC